ncbi:C-factor-like [Branchiostoma floridae]|uniref:C-factor-like n=1 Tax=Branchiostoma floridae TaxID=7739 RepID=A0A9J7KX25_BRAFL|nr:C-factor-like [Branchiostoma floridae]
MPACLVQGASRGIGLQFCRHLLRGVPNSTVIATCRNPGGATELQTLQAEFPSTLHIVPLDVLDEGSIQRAASEVQQHHGGGVDLLINCAGILHPSGRGETSLRDVSSQGLSTTFSTNAVGPLLVAKYFSPLLQKGTGAFGQHGSNKRTHAAVMANLSAKVGSTTDNGLGGWYSYRMSKCALNMATKNLSIELGRGKNKVICVSLHPGTVDTDLSRPYHKNVPSDKLLSTERSVQCLMDFVNGLTMQHTGKFFTWEGKEMPF